jgi:formylglycine-generating enzyme required for sulfatase activity
MMSIAWPRLERIAQSANGAAKEHAAGIIGRFLGEFKALQSNPEANLIIDRDLVFSRKIPEPGNSLKVRVGHRSEKNNQPKLRELEGSFQVCIYPCTRRLYRLFDPGHESHHDNDLDRYAQYPRCPVIDVTWWDAEMFARWSGSRLLTEWEWEYACRAESKDSSGELSKYYWPDDDGGEQIHRYAWVSTNSEEVSHPVGGRDANRYGLFDMLGNVWEWTNSHYDRRRGDLRVFRGGSFDFPGSAVSASCRFHGGPSGSHFFIGFRVARALELKP